MPSKEDASITIISLMRNAAFPLFSYIFRRISYWKCSTEVELNGTKDASVLQHSEQKKIGEQHAMCDKRIESLWLLSDEEVEKKLLLSYIK